VWAEAGLFPVKDLLNLRKIDSDLEGHPTPRLNFIDVATGSLGQGLSVAAGIDYYNLVKRKNYLLKNFALKEWLMSESI
jgi:transketolase N-terminal domain/subunit